MSICQIEAFQDSPAAREEVCCWLAKQAPDRANACDWQRRMNYWWDENPFSSASPERGWVLRHEGTLAGFMALIPAAYAVGGTFTPAMNASTWCVAETHRNASLPMLMKLRRLADTMPMADTCSASQVESGTWGSAGAGSPAVVLPVCHWGAGVAD